MCPGEFLNWLFLLLKPYRLTGKKYLDALDILDDEDKLATFMRMEKWIFDSPDQAGEAFRQFARDFYQGNKLVKGEVRISADRVDLEQITIPILNIYASNDHLVPARCVKSPGRLHRQRGLHRTGTARRTTSASTSAPVSRDILPGAVNEWLRERG